MTDAVARRADFLSGVRVLELGDGVAGAAATGILCALGADVTTVIEPSSPHRRGRPRAARGRDGTSLLSVILDHGKRGLTMQNETGVAELIEGTDGVAFDVIVFDRVLGALGALTSLSDVAPYVAFVDRHNPRAWVSISAFGLSGGRASDVATEITVAAAGGMLSAVRDERTGQPLKLAGQQSLLNTGQAAALAACHALDLAGTNGRVHLDLAAVEATLAMGTVLEVGGLLLDTGSIGGAKRYGAPASFYECTDGLIRISAMEDHQWEGVVTAMGSPEWADHFATVESRIEAAEEVDAHVVAWTRVRTKQDAETLLQSHGVPATAVYPPVEILDSPQLAHRDAFESLALGDGRSASVVGLPFRILDGGNDADPRRPRRLRSLRGLRLLEASRVLAVPLAGAILSTLGVEVTKLEDLARLDMYRRRGPYIDGQQGTERSAYFALMNHSKRSAAFDVDARRDRLDALLGTTDVILENLGPKRARALGLGASTALAQHPDVLAISSSGFGQDGPYANYRAYAYNLQAACALGFLTRTEDGESAEIDIAWADLVSAYALATIVAAWAVGPGGNAGAGIDFSMADLVVAHFNEFVGAASLDGHSDASVDRANELSPYAPHGVYPTSDGWLALAVDGDEQFARLGKVLGHEPLADPAFGSAAGRFDRRHLLDAVIAETTRTRTACELAGNLRAAGVPAEQVMDAEGLLASAQLEARGFLTAVEHGEWGRRRLVGIPWRPYGAPPLALGAPPRLVPLDD
ncbi:MAG TPA: CoA transferase [Acidimicrobiia bacterium]|nr:CoA transferase [Acidimicrobiia bacterium]